jgi:flagellar biogenesis protein FliO
MPKLMRHVFFASALAAGLYSFAPAQTPLSPPANWQGGAAQVALQQQPPRTLPTDYNAPGAAPIAHAPAPRQLARPASLEQPIKLPPAGAAPTGPLDGRLKPLVTGGTSLAIVLGLFLLVVWNVRRGSPRTAGLVPSEAVEVLGRVPISGRQHAHLVRCGNKIVLVSVTASGMEPLTEISDPMEVDRLDSLCRQSSVPGRPLKNLLSRFGSQSNIAFPDDGPDAVDFRHMEVGPRHQR